MGELGSWLVRAREAKGLTLEDAERDTRISRRYLQALEMEQFNIIPAPVYARGFLRSYSQYLGLDPQEMLSLFPREDDFPGARRNEGRASPERPLPSQSPSRPSWRREPESAEPRRAAAPPPPSRYEERRYEEDYGEDDEREYRPQRRPPERYEEERYEDDDRYERPAPRPQRPEPRGERFEAPRRPVPPQRYEREEPMIGVDIGVPAPSRRIRTDPAAQTRTAVVAIVAIGAILGVILLAFVISNLGSDSSESPSGDANGDETATGADGTTTTATAAGTTPAGESGVPRGIVPDVVGLDIAVARAQVEAAGYVVNEARGPSPAPVDEVIGQVPVGDTQYEEGQTVTLAVSDGP
jgi:transcriptional regulator with XRE-family HTH domain